MTGAGEKLIFEPDFLGIAFGVLLVFLSFLLYQRTFPPLSPMKRISLAIPRAAVFLLLILFILNPVAVTVETETKKAVIPVLIDVSRSMAIPDCNGLTRLQAAEEGMKELENTLSGLDLEIVPFAARIYESPVDIGGMPEASGEGTDILGAIEEVGRKYRSNDRESIILLTDGRVTRGMMRSSPGMGARVFAVGYGDTLEGKDVAIEEVDYERFVYSGTRIDIDASVRFSGATGDEDIKLELLQNGDVIDSSMLKAVRGEGTLDASLSFMPRVEGECRLEVRALPVAGERIEDNNIEYLRVTVLKDRLKVLYLDESPDWNMTFIRELGERSERLLIECVTWTPRDGIHFISDRRRWFPPDGSPSLQSYDLLIINDDTRVFNTARRIKILEEFVKAGGGLLLIAGENSPLVSAIRLEMMEGFLPVRRTGDPGLVPGEFLVRKGTAGSGRLSVLAGQPGSMDRLPPLLAALSGVGVTSEAEVPLLLEDGSRTRPFLAVRRYGSGVSAVLFGSTVWRWRLDGDYGASVYTDFLAGLIQYLAKGAEPDRFTLNLDRTVYRTGERPRLSLFMREGKRYGNAGGEVLALGGGEESPARKFIFNLEPGRPGLQRAVLDPLPPGDYKVVARATSDTGEAESAEFSFTVQPVSIEFSRTSRDEPFLRRLVADSGGRIIESDRLGELRDLIRPGPAKIERKKISALREKYQLFALIVILLAAEWILRKSWGLV